MLTGGGDKPYALGMASALSAYGISVDFVGSDELDVPELSRMASLNFLNLRGCQRANASFLRKAIRILIYYLRLARYAATGRPKIFHILWNNKFQFFDRTLLMAYYRLLGKRIVFTAHNVNAAKRDSNDSLLNRLTLRIQYRLADHIFVHTSRMRQELIEVFQLSADKISVIPFGINNTVPETGLTPQEAKGRLGLKGREKAVLFFGNITPYKGLEYLVEAAATLLRVDSDYRLIIAGRPKNYASYWEEVDSRISRAHIAFNVIKRIEFIPDEETEIYFKAADLLVLPYTHVFQSGVLFLGYNFGLPVIASDVGSLRDDIVEGITGFLFRPKDSEDLAATIERYFASDLYRELANRRREIKDFARERYSWDKIGDISYNIYTILAKPN